MGDTGARRRGRGRLVALGLLVAAAAGAALAVQQRRALVERFLLWQLARRGIADAALSVARVGLDECALRDLRLGDGDLELDALELRFSLAGLAAGRLDAARVGNLRVRGRIDAAGLSLGALDALRAGGRDGPAAAPALPVLPVTRLEVERAALLLATPHGPFEAALALDLDASGRGRFAGSTGSLAVFDTPIGVSAAPFALVGSVVFTPDRFEAELEPAAFSLTLATRGAPQPLTGTTPRLVVRGVPGDAVEISGADGEFALLGLGVAARGIGFEARIDPGSRMPSGGLIVREIRDLGAGRFVPLALEARLGPEAGKLGFEGTLRAEGPGTTARFEGSHDPATAEGRLGLELGPLRFGEQGPAPGDLVPALAARVRSASGEVEARGALRWGAAGVDGSADVALRDLTLQTSAARFERVNAAVHFEGPWPPRTPAGQLVSVARVDFGLELTDGLVSFALRRGGTVDLQQAEWGFAGGVIRTSGRFDPFAPRQEVVLEVVGVDLGQLLARVDLEGLSGTGRLDGRLPLSLGGGSVRIREAELHASEAGGWIRYRPRGRAAEALGAVGAALDDLLLALRDFRYERLTLSVDGDPREVVKVAVSLAGANPEHRDGQPYAFNLNVEGHLGDLIRQGTAAYRVPDEVRRRLEAISRGGQAVDAPAPSR